MNKANKILTIICILNAAFFMVACAFTGNALASSAFFLALVGFWLLRSCEIRLECETKLREKIWNQYKAAIEEVNNIINR